MKLNSYKAKVNLGVSIFVLWMFIQFIRATFGGEPYPAIYLPGFPGNGSEPLESRELYVKIDGEYVLITDDQAPFGHSRYRKLLRQFSNAFESGDKEKIERQVEGLLSLPPINKGDSIRIEEVVWMPEKNGYSRISKSSIKFKLDR